MTTSPAAPAPPTTTPTTAPEPQLSFTEPGELIAAVPHLLGFTPSDSIVLITLTGPDLTMIGATLRADLPPPDQVPAMARRLLVPVLRHDTTATVLMVVGGALQDESGPPHRDLVDAVADELAEGGVAVAWALWVAAIEDGAPWRSYGEEQGGGVVPDPSASGMAHLATASGIVTYPSRDELAATVAPDPPVLLAERAEAVDAHAADAAGDVESEARGVRLMRDTVRRAALDVGRGPLELDEDTVVRLAVALSYPRVRDVCLRLAGQPEPIAAERVWAALTRAIPPPWCSEAALLLAITAYLRGDGALAGMAVDRALEADEAHPLAGLVRWALNLSMRPDQLRRLVERSYALAERSDAATTPDGSG
ncbi:DUF4192 domain-containing protein [Herbihabitans rhizosphaerae]|nr:DUF4192 domain-containing protein [Herbihabitans rhizosphaerae]